MILTGDCLEIMPTLEAESVDSIVTDPPYGLSFMGKDWDHGVPGVPFWEAALRVAKPGAFLLAFGGTRTFHRLAVAIEDAGWEIRDTVMWVYGSGFPKSLDVSKAIDKAAGAERKQIGVKKREGGPTGFTSDKGWHDGPMGNEPKMTPLYAPATDAARQWEGWGTALKPAHEPVIVGYRPLTKPQFVAILAENIRSLLCQCLPANDAEKSFTDTQAKSYEAARSVPDHARIYELANSGNVRFVASRFICRSAESNVATENSVHENVRQNGNQDVIPEAITLLGMVEDFSNQLTDIFMSDTAGNIEASTVLSWNNISDALLNQANIFTIATGIRLTTALRTLSLFLSQIISNDIGNSSLNLSPNFEPIIVARKPIEGNVAENVLKYGTGGLNIDGCRVEYSSENDKDIAHYNALGMERLSKDYGEKLGSFDGGWKKHHPEMPEGRWPANLIHDGSDEVVGLFPHSTSGAMKKPYEYKNNGFSMGAPAGSTRQIHDSNEGSAARFFYCAKSSRAERERGLEDAPKMAGHEAVDRDEGSAGLNSPRAGAGRTARTVGNHHPTVKPLALMVYLCRLVTPPSGVILDPFMGSGSTGKAATLEGFQFIGIELEKEYAEIAERRIDAARLPIFS